MSGGAWGYSGFVVRDRMETVAEDERVKERFPLVAAAMCAAGAWFERVEHDLDWDACSDAVIEEDATFDRTEFGKLLDAILKIAPDEWFPRGKFATIQAVQGRVEEKEVR